MYTVIYFHHVVFLVTPLTSKIIRRSVRVISYLHIKEKLLSLHLIILKFEWIVENTQCNSKHARMHDRGLITEESVVILYHVCRISATMTILYHQFSQHLKN